MTPSKCLERECPRFSVHEGIEACTVRVDNYKRKAYVKPVFEVGDKECRRLRNPKKGGSK